MKTTVSVKPWFHQSAVTLFIPVLMAVIVPGVFAQAMYSVTDLGTLAGGSFSMAAGINNYAQVVGYADYHAFLYGGGHISDLGTLPTGSYSHANAINDSGQIVGISGLAGGQEQAFLYSGGRMTALSSSIYSPTDINNSGQIVGATFGYHAFLYTGGVMTDLGSSSVANAINNNGQVVGQNGASHAFLYSAGHLTDLGTLGGAESSATGINDVGQVVGYSYPAGNAAWHAFLYDGGHMTDLGIFAGGTGFYTQAYAINNNGQVVGTADSRAFLYAGGRMVDLNTLIPSDARWSLSTATGINDNGQIVGTGFSPSGQQHAFLLTPIPEPATLSMLALVCVVVMLRRPWRGVGHPGGSM
jgi:probable HAF family extracellular repeat protein